MGNVSLSAALKKNRRKNNLAFTRRNWTNISKCSLLILWSLWNGELGTELNWAKPVRKGGGWLGIRTH